MQCASLPNQPAYVPYVHTYVWRFTPFTFPLFRRCIFFAVRNAIRLCSNLGSDRILFTRSPLRMCRKNLAQVKNRTAGDEAPSPPPMVPNSQRRLRKRKFVWKNLGMTDCNRFCGGGTYSRIRIPIICIWDKTAIGRRCTVRNYDCRHAPVKLDLPFGFKVSKWPDSSAYASNPRSTYPSGDAITSRSRQASR